MVRAFVGDSTMIKVFFSFAFDILFTAFPPRANQSLADYDLGSEKPSVLSAL